MAYIGKTPTVGNFQVCDAISVVNGQAAYTLQVGGANVAPESANHMLVSLNGILQKPGSSFTISGSTMTFASNLATGDVIDFVQILGNVLDLGQPSDDTVTAAKLNNDVISGQTALTSAPDDTDELLISDAGTIKRIDVSLVGGKNTPAFYVTPSSDQSSIADNTLTQIAFGQENFDTDSAFASNTFTVPSGAAGKYFFNVTLFVESANYMGNAEIYFYLNDSQNVYSNVDLADQTTGGLSHTAVLNLSAGDTIKVYTRIDVASNGTYTVNQDNPANTSRCWWVGYKLIG